MAAVVLVVSSSFTSPEPGAGCSDAGCDYTLTDAGKAAASNPVSDGAPDDTDHITSDATPDPCPWMVVESLGAESSWWDGNDPSAGHVELNACALKGDGTDPGVGVLQTRFVPNAAPAVVAATPPDPAVLARQAVGRLVVPRPTIGVGPDRSKLAVQLWTWLWVDDVPPAPVTVTLDGVSVTATATLSTTTWSLGEPANTGSAYQPGPPVTVTCIGAGTPPPPGYDWQAEPPCGHMFKWRSLKERTGGIGKWPITVTTTWNVTWLSNTGLSGADLLTATSSDAFEIGEYRIVLVDGPGG